MSIRRAIGEPKLLFGHSVKRALMLPRKWFNRSVSCVESVLSSFIESKCAFWTIFFSLEPGNTVYGNVIGPLNRGKVGAQYTCCLVDRATRLGDAMRMRDTSTSPILRALQHWLLRNGLFKVLITDNAGYYASSELEQWCTEHSVGNKFTAP